MEYDISTVRSSNFILRKYNFVLPSKASFGVGVWYLPLLNGPFTLPSRSVFYLLISQRF